MRILKLEQATHNSGILGTLITADTEMSSAIPADAFLANLDDLLKADGCLMPEEMNESDLMIAHNCKLRCETPFYSREIVDACAWLKGHQAENIILGVHSAFINSSTRTWFVTYWTLPYQWTSMRKNLFGTPK